MYRTLAISWTMTTATTKSKKQTSVEDKRTEKGKARRFSGKKHLHRQTREHY
jgi:hypothetical protein